MTEEGELVTIFSNLVMPASNITEEILDMEDDMLKTGGRMFIYLISCLNKDALLFKRIFQQSVSGIFISIKKIVEKSNNQEIVNVGKEVLNELLTTLKFQYLNIVGNSTFKFRMRQNLTNVEGK